MIPWFWVIIALAVGLIIGIVATAWIMGAEPPELREDVL